MEHFHLTEFKHFDDFPLKYFCETFQFKKSSIIPVEKSVKPVGNFSASSNHMVMLNRITFFSSTLLNG